MNDAGETKRNLNTILLAIVIAVLLGNGAMTMKNTVALAELAAVQVSRVEMETKLQTVRLDVIALAAEVAKVKLDLVSLQIQARK